MKAHRDIWTAMTGVILASFLVVVITQPAEAQDNDYDARWLPWLGCWELTVGPTDSEAPMLCLRSVAAGKGVEMLSVTDGEIVAQEPIRADGMNRQTSREGCEGWERTSFSDIGYRVYLRAEFVCEGGLERNSGGLMSMVSPYEWLDVRTVEVGGESVPWVLRYQLATREAVEAAGLEDITADRAMAQQVARIAASSALTIEDIIDASAHMDAKAVEAWVVERGDQFTLDASRLVAMADAGVPESVIDMVVAVSYPEHFVVDRGLEGNAELAESEYSRRGPYGRSGRIGYGYGYGYAGYYDPFFLSPFYSPYAGYGYNSPYRYGFGYGLGYGGYGFGYGTYGRYRPTIVVVGRREHVAPGPFSRAIRGRGYTRGSGGSSSGSEGARAQGRSGGVSAAPSRPGSSSSGSSSSGRKAKPRGGSPSA